jgi:O-antigen/teichoic acid export membrane protein
MLFAVVVKFVSASSGLLIGALLARLLSIKILGSYFVLIQFIRVSAIFIQLGLSNNLMRVIAVAADQGDEVFIVGNIKSALKFLLLAFFGLTTIYYLFWPAITNCLNIISTESLLWLIFLCIAIRALEDHLTFILKGLHQVKLSIALLNSPRQIISVAFLLLIWISEINFSLQGAFFLYILASIPAMIFGLAFILKLVPCILKKIETIPNVPLLKSSMPFLGMNLLSILMASGPLWLVSGLVGKTEAGLYGAAVQLTFMISFFLGINNQITPPALAALVANNEKEQLESILRKTSGWGLMLSTPAVVMLLFFGKPILSIVYGPAFSEAGIVLAFLTIGQFVNAAAGSPGMMLQMSGKQSSLLAITSIWMILTLIGGITLTPNWGMNGIAAAHCLALIGQNLTMVLLVRQQIGVRTYAHLNFGRLLFSERNGNDLN